MNVQSIITSLNDFKRRQSVKGRSRFRKLELRKKEGRISRRRACKGGFADFLTEINIMYLNQRSLEFIYNIHILRNLEQSLDSLNK
jgi:hypothetical protein